MSHSVYLSALRPERRMGDYSAIQTTPPAARPVSVDELQLQLGLPLSIGLDSAQTAELERMIDAATHWFEGQMDRQLIQASWTVKRTRWPYGRDPIELPVSPVSAVGTITYTDPDGATQNLDSSVYRLALDRLVPAIYPAWETHWPGYRPVVDGISIPFTAGYGTAASDVPPMIRSGVLLLAAHFYEHRNAAEERVLAEIPFGVSAIINHYSTGNEFTTYS